MKRRDFIKTAAVITAASTLTASGPIQAGEFTGKITKAVKYGMIKGAKTPEDKVLLLKDLGYDGVEPGVLGEEELKALRNASEKHDMPVHGIVNGSINNISRAVDQAKYIGATSVLLVAGRVNEDMSYADNYRITQDAIRKAIPHAEKQGILLLVENVWNNFLLSPLEMARYIDEFESDQVKVYFDVGNVVRFAYPEHWIPVLGHRIHKLDIKEYSRQKQNDEGLWKGFNVAIGEGSIDWGRIRAELKKINYTGWATAEVGGGGREHLQVVAAQMDKVLDL